MAMEKKQKFFKALPYMVRKVKGTDSYERIKELEETMAEKEQEYHLMAKSFDDFRKSMVVDITKLTSEELAHLLTKMSKEEIRILLLQMRRFLSLQTKLDELESECMNIRNQIIYLSHPKYLLVEAMYEEQINNTHHFSVADILELMTESNDLSEYQQKWFEVYRKQNAPRS